MTLKKWIFPVILFWAFLLSGVLLSGERGSLHQSSEPPVIPVGEDAYLMWDRLAYQRIGARAYMRSTYDRQGNNRTADASHFLYQESDAFNVTLDVKGTGILYFKRTNHWHGSPWHYEVDDNDFIVKETATADPVHAKERLKKTVFIPESLFPNPLTWTWTTTHGANLMWVPIPFEESFRLAYGRTFYGTGYYIYHLFAPGTRHVSRPISSWEKKPPSPDVLSLLNRSGSDIAPQGKGVRTTRGRISMEPNEWIALQELDEAPSVMRLIRFKVPKDAAYAFGQCRLRMTWDQRWHASVDAPIALFFGAGHLYNNDGREYLVKGFPMVIRYTESYVELSCYYPMPFFRHARIEVQNTQYTEMKGIEWEVRTVPFTDPINHVGYFHATYSDHPKPVLGQDLVFLDTQTAEGGGAWSGQFVGMSWIFSRLGVLHTLEGDPRFFFDGSKIPQAWGTGTEEWGGGGDYWGGRNMTLPFAGHPVGASAKPNRREPDKWRVAVDEKDQLNSAYRFLIADHFPFGNSAVIRLEHGAMNQTREHYSGVVYWYGMDSPTLVLTDELNVCNERSIESHHYASPTAQEPYTLVSRYEWGPDGDVARWSTTEDYESELLYFPAEEDKVRIMTGTSQFTVKLDPDNLGVMLRRKFDYRYPNQRAKVWVKPAGTGDSWSYAGEWYTSGSNTCVYSNPKNPMNGNPDGELGKTRHNIVTSNRRWREEEFLIARQLTEGVDRLDIKIEFIPNEMELFPGKSFPAESAWSEARYWVYCYRMSRVRFQDELSIGETDHGK